MPESVFVMFCMAGIICLLGLVIRRIVSLRRRVKNGFKVPGTFVRYESEKWHLGLKSYYPVVAFTALTGERIEGRSDEALSVYDLDLAPNTILNVIYQPQNPATFFLESQGTRAILYPWIVTLLYILFAFALSMML